MLTHPTLEKLHSLKLNGMAKALEEQIQMQDLKELSFEERLGLLVDREVTERRNRKLRTLLKKAKLRLNASLEDIDYRHPRGLDKSLTLSLASCQWVKEHNNILITGPTGVGKSYLACALAQKACREGYRTLYFRLTRLLQELTMARGDGRYGKMLIILAKNDLLVIDDWGLAPLDDHGRRDILEILEDRHNVRSTLVTSQIPCLLYTSPSPRDATLSRMPSSA